MLIDFTKLFPKSCELQNISSLVVNVSEISYMKRVSLKDTKPGDVVQSEDHIQVGDVTYKFPAVDDGIIILRSIKDAEDLLLEFDANIISLTPIQNTHKKITEEYLADCSAKYAPAT